MPVERLILFAKRPVLGRVKTRLVPPLSPEQALRLHGAFLRDQTRFVASLAAPGRVVELCLDGDPRQPPPLRIPTPVACTAQGSGDLGERMLRAFTRARDGGAERTVIIGADAPSLPSRLVEAAYERLRRGHQAVVVPAEDGGYVLVGLRAPIAEIFVDIPWGQALVLSASRARAAAAGITLSELEPWRDVDTWDDLERLAADLAATPGRAPLTARIVARLIA